MQPTSLLKVGECYKDFCLKKIVFIEDLDSTLRELVHIPSGALVMHIENSDPENLFCLSFKTLPSNSNGAPHILEHTVLCGSHKYPVKDPFFAMNRRSLNTFMNALTGADFTCYPAASQVEKDFYNLLEVYIDAVFHPELKKMSFLQEGHRLEFTEKDNPNTPLLYKGIVYNEMKGSLASADSRLWHKLLSLLVPDLPYAYNSGGDPHEIPSLSYEELLAFHETFYHPSRCLFFFYGNFPLNKHLDTINEKALRTVVKLPPIPPIQRQKRFTAPKKEKGVYPTLEHDISKNKTIVSFGFLTAPIIEQSDILALQVLDCILMDTDASPLKAHLLDSHLCIQVDALLDLDMSEIPYTIICKGCSSGSEDAIEKLLFEGFHQIIKDGIPRHLIEAALHQIELAKREISTGNYPFGLTLFMRSALYLQHGCPAETGLSFCFDELWEKVGNKEYFSSLIRKYFIDNPHFVRLTLEPDTTLLAKEEAVETQTLENIHKNLSAKDKKEIIEQTKRLELFQASEEKVDLECLPKVSLTDVPPITRDFILEKSKKGSLDIFHYPTFTNHILYTDLFFPLREVSFEELPYLQLLLSILPELGAGNRSYTDNLGYMQAHTGGIHFSLSFHPSVDPSKQTAASIHLHAKALYRKVDKLFALLSDELTQARFDEKTRIQELVAQMLLRLETNLSRMAAKYAMLMAQTPLSQIAAIEETCYGLSFFKALQKIDADCKKNLDHLVETLHNLYKRIFHFTSLDLVLGCDAKMATLLYNENFYGLSHLPLSSSPLFTNYIGKKHRSDYLGKIIASKVAFNAEAFQTPSYLDNAAPYLHLSSKIFENCILHKIIREQKGAYGSGATYSPLLGLFTFHSYRDPHVFSTHEAFELAIKTIGDGQFSDTDLEQAKFGLIQDFDTPLSPGSKTLAAYTWWREGKDKALRQLYRKRVLEATKEDIAKAVTKNLLPEIQKGIFISFGGKDLLMQEKPLFKEKPFSIEAI